MSEAAQNNKSALLLWHEGLELMLVSSPCFRQGCGVEAKDDARPHVYWDESEEPAYEAADQQKELRPLAILSQELFSYVRYGIDASIALAATGGVAILIVDNARHPENYKQSKAHFLQFAGGVIDDLAELSGSGDYLPLTAIDVVGKPLRSPPDERNADDWWSLIALCRFGSEG